MSQASSKKYHGKSNSKHSTSGSNKEIPFLSSIEDTQAMKLDLQVLMTDFKQGKLHAFGTEGTRNQMDRIRYLQRSLARLHFDLDNQIDYQSTQESSKIVEKQNENMTELLKNMDVLGSAMLSLSEMEGSSSQS